MNWKEWIKAAGIRAIKTFAQTAASLITVGAVVSEIQWGVVFSSAAVAAINHPMRPPANRREVFFYCLQKFPATKNL